MMVGWVTTQPTRLIEQRTSQSASSYRWEVVTKVVEAPTGFLVYRGPVVFDWLPGDGFDPPADARRFADLARAKVPNYVVLGECQFPAKPEPIGLDEL